MRSPQAKSFYVSGGTLPLGSESYVERSCDAALFNALSAGRYCYVLNSRQMGKSSLSVRTMARLEAQGTRTIFVDLTGIGGRNITADQWYMGLCGEVGRDLGLRMEMLTYARGAKDLSSMQKFFGALREVVLNQIQEPIVLFIDEIDSTRNLVFDTDEFFAGIRECYNRRVHDPAYERLTFCLIGVAVPSDLVRNPNTTPFNIGERIHLQDLTEEELMRLAPPLGPNGEELVRRVHYWTNGQPFLSQSLCQAIASDDSVQTAAQVDALVREQLFEPRAKDTNINLADVANRALNSGAYEADPERFRADLLSAYQRAWRGGRLLDDEANRVAVLLKLSGLMRSDGVRLLVRNRIYREVFDQKWIHENMPGQELRRQQQSFRRGIIRATAASAAIVGTVAVLGIVAWQAERAAERAKVALDYELYVADMNSMRVFEESGDITRMEDVLRRTEHSPYRGFEWGFWLGRLHDAPEEYTLDYSAPGKREEGLLSQDDRLLCIRDALLGTATVVDRKTKRVLAMLKSDPDKRIVATRAGFLSVQLLPDRVTTTDLLTGKVVSEFRTNGSTFEAVSMRDQSDYVAMYERSQADPTKVSFIVGDLVTGKAHYRYSRPGYVMSTFSSASEDGRRVLLYEETISSSPKDQHKGELVVRSVEENRELDRFPCDPAIVSSVDLSDKGHWVVYRTSRFVQSARDVDHHRVAYTKQSDESSSPIFSRFGRAEAYVVNLFANGRVELSDILGGKTIASRSNTWAFGWSRAKDNVIASSSSVRIADRRESAGARVIATGVKALRDDCGVINVFDTATRQFDRLTDPGLKLISHVSEPPGLRAYTYNGRWRLTQAEGQTAGTLSETGGRVPPIRIDPLPANFAGGVSGDHVAVLRRYGKVVVGISTKTGKVDWELTIPERGITSMWVSPDGRHLCAIHGLTRLLVIDMGTGKIRKEVEAHNVRLTNIVFASNPNRFFTCGADGRVILWDAPTLMPVREFRGNASQRTSGADLSPDGRRVATCDFTGGWQLWDAETGVQLMNIQGSSLPLKSVIFTSDGREIITAGDDLRVRAWSTLTKDPSYRIPFDPAFQAGITK